MELAITSLGLLCSVGLDVVTACAAIRAGLVRPRELSSVRVLEGSPAIESALIGHPIVGYTEGFGGVGRWLRLALGGLADLRRYGTLPDEAQRDFWRRTGLVAALPWLPPSQQDSSGQEDGLTRRAYLLQLLHASRLPIPDEHVSWVRAGHVGAVEAICRAGELIAKGQVDRVMVVACDSYFDEATLMELLEQRRLKTGDVPCGLAPGEAAACLLLESARGVRQRQARVEAWVRFAATTHDARFTLKGPHDGEMLSQVTKQALAPVGTTAPFSGDVLTDLNGENWRALAVALMRVRLSSQLSPAARLLTFCDSTGDVGAASGAVSVCIAARAWRRGYSFTEQSLVLSLSDRGHCGALVLERPRS